MARLMAMFMVKNDFPLPGLNEVTTITLEDWSLPIMNSRLVRKTRKASFMMSRFPSLTTMVCASCDFTLFLPRIDKGISPIKGTLKPSRSFLPRTRVFMFSRMNTMTTGINIPKAKATRKMFFFTGAVGIMLPPGFVIIRVL